MKKNVLRLTLLIIIYLIIGNKNAGAQWTGMTPVIFNNTEYKKVGINTGDPNAVLQINSYTAKNIFYPSNIKLVTGEGNDPNVFEILGALDGTFNFFVFHNKILSMDVTKSTFSNNLQIDGNVGIGTSTPNSKLNVHNGSFSITTNATGNTINDGLVVDMLDNTWSRLWNKEQDGVIGFRASNFVFYNYDEGMMGAVPMMNINESEINIYRNTSIGTNTSARNLNIYGNVGIGNSEPVEKLEVSGNISTNGVYMFNRQQVFSTQGTGCVFIGINAGSVNTSIHNTFVGQASGRKNTTGNFNAFFGSSTGIEVTTGSNNTFIGTGAGQVITTGHSNTYIGKFAGANNGCSEIYNSIAIGANAKVSNSNSMQFGNNGVTEFTFGNNAMKILNGSVIIGTGIKMWNDGKIWASTEIRVQLNQPSEWGDFVFDANYNLKPLSEVEAYINANKHLEGVPSATEIETNGINLGEMTNTLTQKVEELTLYIIEQNKNIETQKKLSEVQNKMIEA